MAFQGAVWDERVLDLADEWDEKIWTSFRRHSHSHRSKHKASPSSTAASAAASASSTSTAKQAHHSRRRELSKKARRHALASKQRARVFRLSPATPGAKGLWPSPRATLADAAVPRSAQQSGGARSAAAATKGPFSLFTRAAEGNPVRRCMDSEIALARELLQAATDKESRLDEAALWTLMQGAHSHRPAVYHVALGLLPFRLLQDLHESANGWDVSSDDLHQALFRAVNKEKHDWVRCGIQRLQRLQRLQRPDAGADGTLPTPAATLVRPVFDQKTHACVEELRVRALDAAEARHPLLDVAKHRRTAGNGRPAIVGTLEHFRLNFEVFCGGVLRGIDLTDVVVGGSSVQACLLALDRDARDVAAWHEHATAVHEALMLPPELSEQILAMAGPPRSRGALEASARHRFEVDYADSDLDLFVVAPTLEAAAFRVSALVRALRASLGRHGPVDVVRTGNTVTVIPPHPMRNVQVVLSAYQSVSELLSFADLDCTAVAYDGRQVWMHERARRALATRCNFVPPGLLHRPEYQRRLLKYSLRGFSTLFIEVCKHEPRCDIELDTDYAQLINRLGEKVSLCLTSMGSRHLRELRAKGDYDSATPAVPQRGPHGRRSDRRLRHLLDSYTRLHRMEAAELDAFDERAVLTALDPEPQPAAADGMDVAEGMDAAGDAAGDAGDAASRPPAFPPLLWRFQRVLREHRFSQHVPSCYQCGQLFVEVFDRPHAKTASLCDACAQANRDKAAARHDLAGTLAVVTGGRIKIGLRTALKLLRCGARVIVTTRFPKAAARTYAAEPDFERWSHRLHIYGLDLRHLPSLTRFIQHIGTHEPCVDILINNACQTVRRPSAYYFGLCDRERRPLPQPAHQLLRAVGVSPRAPLSIQAYDRSSVIDGGGGEGRGGRRGLLALVPLPWGGGGQATSASLTQCPVVPEDRVSRCSEHFPAGRTDEHGEQLDLRSKTTWTSTLDEVPAAELLEVQLVNSIAPAMLVSELFGPMTHRSENDGRRRFVVNVTSQEGQFSAAKTGVHVHTNMAKAALNMLTRSLAGAMAARDIFVTSVDTGWVSRMRPGNPADARMLPPLSEEDGASRVLDPVLQGYAGRGQPLHGVLLKNFEVVDW